MCRDQVKQVLQPRQRMRESPGRTPGPPGRQNAGSRVEQVQSRQAGSTSGGIVRTGRQESRCRSSGAEAGENGQAGRQ